MKTYLHYISILILLLSANMAAANNVNVNASTASDASLKSIVLSTATTLVYSTGPANYNYTTSVDPNTASLSVEPTTNDPNATVTVNGVAVASGASSGQITLNGIVTTTINLVSISQDKTDTLTYSIVVYESGSNDAFLSALSISTGNTLVPTATGPGDYNYTTSVAPGTTSLTVTPTTVDPTATLKVTGAPVASGSPSGPQTLNAIGSTTTINTVVTAQDGVTTQTYSIIVSRTGSNTSTLSALSLNTSSPLFTSTGSSNFSASNLNYTALVSSTTTSVTIKPTVTDPNSTVTVNGVATTSASFSASVPVNASGSTVIPIVVTAQDGTTKSSYSISISKNAAGTGNSSGYTSLILSSGSNLIGTSPNFTTSVSPSSTSLAMTITTIDPNASILVNGVSAASGVLSSAVALNSSGTTAIPIVITSSDGTSIKSFTITVSKNGSNNSSASLLSLTDVTTNTPATLVQVGSSTVNYTSSISTLATQASLTVTAADANANVVISVGGVTQASGTGSAAANTIALNTAPGPTNVTVVITAQDGVTQTTYTIAISQSGSTNANISSIVVTPNGASFSSVLVNSTSGSANYNASYHANYNTSVSPSTTAVTVNTTAADKNAVITISINGGAANTATTGVGYPVTLTPTSTFVLVKVTSPSSTVTYSYGITIYPKGSNNASIVTPPVLSTGTTLNSIASTLNYNTVVSPNTTTVTVTATTIDPNAKISVNGLAAVSASPSNPITLNTSGTTTVSILCTAEDGVTTKTYNIYITRSGTTYTWIGGTSSSWTTPANWSPAAVPGPGDVASFTNSSPSFQPSITNATTVGEIVFNTPTPTTTTLTITAGVKLIIGTRLTVNSATTFKSSASGVALIDVSAAATVNIASTLTLNSSPTPVTFTLKSAAASTASVGQITSPLFSIVGNVTVERYIQGGSTTYRGYRLLSSPVYAGTVTNSGLSSNVYSINYITSTSFVTGSSGTTNGFDNSPSNNPSLYLFREDKAANNYSFTGGNYWGISKINNTIGSTGLPAYAYSVNGLSPYYIPVGNGFFFFYRGDRTTTYNKFSSSTAAESTVMSTTGTLNQGQIIVHNWFTLGSSSLSYTTTVANAGNLGFNLVGNPYASSIDWDTFSSTSSSASIYGPNTGGAIYIIDPVSKNYGVYVANSSYGGTNNATHVIPSGQGFFVQASASGASLTFNESAKTTVQVTGANLLMGTPVANAVGQYLHLKLSKDTVQADEVFISFNSSAKSKFVLSEDAAQKPGFGVASLATMSSDGVPLSINTLALPSDNESIALNVGATASGNYVLAMPEIKSVPALYSIWLMDAYKKDSVDMRQSPTYSFTINTSDAASYGVNRFSIVIRQNTNLTLRLLNFSAAKATGGARIVWKTVNEQNYTNFTVERSTNNGNSFDDLGGFVSSDEGTYSFLDKSPLITSNLYRLKLVDVNGATSYSKIVTLQYSTLSDNLATTAVNVYPNPTHGMINLAINQSGSTSFASGYSALQTLGSTPGLNNDQTVSAQSYDIRIFSITGNLVKSAKSTQPTWQSNVSDLQPGTYVIQVLNSSDKSVIGKSTFVKL